MKKNHTEQRITRMATNRFLGSQCLCKILAVVALGGVLSATAPAQTYKYFQYDPTRTAWNANNWSTASGGPYTGAWASYNDAIFELTAGTVSLGANQNANSVTFNSTGYILTGNTLTLGNPGAYWLGYFVKDGYAATISSALGNSGGGNTIHIGKSGYQGTLTLNGNFQNLTSNNRRLEVNYGTLYLSTSSTSLNGGTGGIDIASGATLTYDNSSTVNWGTGGTTTLTGLGTFVKEGAGNLILGSGGQTVNINLSTGAVIDLQNGTIETSSAYRGVWTGNYADLNIGSAGTFKLKENQVYVGALTGSGTIQQDYSATAPTLTIGRGDRSGTFNGIIKNGSNTLSLQKVGNGTQVLTGNNTYTGGTTINAGTLQVNSTGALSGTATINSAGVLTLNAGNSQTWGNTIAGSGLLKVLLGTGSGNTILNGVSGFGGTIQISSAGTNGDKWRTNGINAPGVTGLIDPNNQLYVVGGVSTFNRVYVSGTGNNENRGAIRLENVLNAPVFLLGDTTIGGSSGYFNGTIQTAVAGVSTLRIGAPSQNGFAANSFRGVISDGTGTLALEVYNANLGNMFIAGSMNNTFSGGMTLLNVAGSGTRLVINSAITGTPYGSGAITIGQSSTDKAGIYFTTGTTLANDIVFNTGLGTDTPGIRLDAAGITLSGTLTANLSDIVLSARAGTTYGATLTGKLTGSNGLTLDNTYNNINVTLNNAAANNDYQGNTTIAGSKGFLSLGAANQIPNGAGAGNLVNNGGVFNLNGNSETINGLSGTGGAVDGISGTPTLTVGDNDATATYAGVIRNTGGTLALTKIGTGTQTLSGANTYSGITQVTQGTLVLKPSTIAGVNSYQSNTSVAGGAFFEIDITGLGGVYTGGNAGNPTTTPTVRQGLTLSGPGTWRITGGSGDRLALDNQSGSPAGVTISLGAGGLIDIQGGTLINGGYGGGIWTGNLASLYIATGAAFDIWDGNPVTVDALTGGGTIRIGSNSGATTYNTLTVGVNGGSGVFSGNIDATPLGGANNQAGNITLVKTGTGTQILTGANTYTGTTAINGGTLLLTGSGAINNSSGVQINGGKLIQNSSTAFSAPLSFGPSGGTLGGIGTVTGPLTVGANAVLSPGNSPGTQSFIGTQTWLPGGTYLWEINDALGTAGSDPGWDLINITGTLDLTGLVSPNQFTIDIVGLALSNFNSHASYAFPILNATTISGFDSNTFTFATVGTPGFASWSIAEVGSTLWLNYTSVVPEPTVVALFGLGSLLLLLGRRLQRRRP